ncbi:S8 family serine peptidase [Rossellomorea aquimaris]|nr:S8 family serine peptidase [Rossellomorea aquimaris]
MKLRLLVLVVLCLAFVVPANTSLHSEASTMNHSKVEDGLLAKFTEAGTPLEIIVSFTSQDKHTQKQVLQQTGIEKGILLNQLPMAGMTATKEQIAALSQSSKVRSIYYNQKLEYENADATRLTGVDKVRTDGDFIKKNGGLPITGDGVGVVVNDSGVDGTHKDLEFGDHLVQNVAAFMNLNAVTELAPVTYVENVPNTDNNSGHGTHVAGIVGATGKMSSGKHEGVAPGADLVGYGSGAGLAILDTLGAFDYSLTHQFEYNIRVITNSWGDTSEAGKPFDPEHPINIATKKLFDRGILTVFSAGNSGPGEGTISGNYKKAPWVVTVAAGTKGGELTEFSSRGLKDVGGTVSVDGQEWHWTDAPTVTAPGENIISTRVISPIPALGATIDVEFIDPAYLPYYTTMSGTSMAAPHVAGIAALLFEANPTLTPLDVKEILTSTATNMPNDESWEVGAGYVNAYQAVKEAYIH